MNFVESIARKRDGAELGPDEIRAFVAGAASGEIGDEQLAAMLMAICLRGASAAETTTLVEAMRDSGARWRLADDVPGVVDKHSTGGVGDTVSLIFAPLVAACGVPVAMMAGAGLGHTQGTLDKLAAIPAFRVATTRAEALERLRRCGVCFAAQSAEIAPADRKLYALRDLTGTVPSVPLIVASIMSKKLAVGASSLALDVKFGSGAFCRTLGEGRALAQALVAVARRAGVRVRALVTDMSQPLGDRLGTASEVRAAVDVLEGLGDARLRELSSTLAAAALQLAGVAPDEAAARTAAALADGSARAALDRVVEGHGGRPDFAALARPVAVVPVPAPRGGIVSAIAAEELGWIAVSLGAGRRHREDRVDPAAGLVVHARIGDRVEAGEPVAALELGSRPVDREELIARTRAAFAIGDGEVAPPPLVAAVLDGIS